jgi:AraC-like DNA-binding protein
MTLLSTSYRAGLMQPHQELALWRDNLSTLFDIHAGDPGAFHMSIDAYNLGSLVLGPIRTARQRYQRSRRLIASHGIDHYLVQLYRTGGYQGVNGKREIHVRPGDLSILDLSQVVESRANAADLFNILVPRPLLDAALRRGTDLTGLVLRGDTALGGLLRDYLRALGRRMPALTEHETPAVVEATIAVIAACVGPTAAALERAQPALEGVQLARMKCYIAKNLGTAELGPELLADHFHVSRAALYRAFAAQGGVARYIRALRLERCARALADPVGHHRSVQAIAEEHGFACPAHFSRLFRQTFGMAPSEARAIGRTSAAEAAPHDAAVLDGWIRALGAG